MGLELTIFRTIPEPPAAKKRSDKRCPSCQLKVVGHMARHLWEAHRY